MPKMNNKNEVAKTKIKDKSNMLTAQKHSTLFYISPSLFNNKRLKQYRIKWAKLYKGIGRRKFKTYTRRRQLTTLQASVTIDLLSDDDVVDVDVDVDGHGDHNHDYNHDNNDGDYANMLNAKMCNNASISRSMQGHDFQQNITNSESIENQPKMPQITFVKSLAIQSPQQKPNHIKRRKSQKPIRRTEPVIVNNESIVLTDDSDTEAVTTSDSNAFRASTPMNNGESPSSSSAMPNHIHSAQVDEEVTVSIVPRNSGGRCIKANSEEVFPMLPDETTVHTVIANRIYELSLTKLREGLASCGMPEFTNGEQKVTPQRRKTAVNPPVVATTPPPISLKLSSDLSISLISDDEDDTPSQISPEKLLEQQPQLSVQQLRHRPVTTNNTHQVPRRRKLG